MPPSTVDTVPLVPGQLWTLHASGNRFLGVMEIYNNALIVRVPSGLVVVNPPSSSPRHIEAVRRLSEAVGASVCALFSPGDWHHFHLLAWAAAFGDARLYVASARVLKKQPGLQGRAVVLSREGPSVPELEPCCTILPWLGSKQPPRLLGGDRSGTARVEHLVFHHSSRTLFVTDHVMGPGLMGAAITANKGGFSHQSGEGSALRASAQRILDAAPCRIVFSHGHRGAFIMGDGTPDAGVEIRAQLAKAYRFFGL